MRHRFVNLGQEGMVSPETRIRLILSSYRGIAFALAAIHIVHSSSSVYSLLLVYFLLSTVGIYTALKVFSPFQWYERDTITYVVIGADVSLAVLLLLLTGGLSSPFLLYSLASLLTVALLFPRSAAFSVAILLSVSAVTWQAASAFFPFSTLYSTEDSFTLLPIYVIACFLLALIPYVANINIWSRINYQATQEERGRLSRQIHDSLAQTLSILNWGVDLVQESIIKGEKVEALAELGKVREAVATAHKEARESVELLRLKIVENRGLPSALADYVQGFSQASGIKCQLHLCDGQVNLPPLAELQLMYIAQEALTNVRKHATASHVELTLESNSSEVRLKIKDNGCGFNASAFPIHNAPRKSRGLAVMKERAESLGGSLVTTSIPGCGTEVEVKVPTRRLGRLL